MPCEEKEKGVAVSWRTCDADRACVRARNRKLARPIRVRTPHQHTLFANRSRSLGGSFGQKSATNSMKVEIGLYTLKLRKLG